MRTIKIGDHSIDTLSLQCSLPGLTLDGDFGANTERAVKEFQKDHGLDVDGIVGPATWSLILPSRPKISEGDWERVSKSLGVEVAILKAIHEVETSSQSYLPQGYPALLFEAHIFYRELKALGKDVMSLISLYPGIISKTWDKKLYLGGIREVPRINEAYQISPEAALRSASWGAFQICGFNAGPSGVFEFYRKIWTSETGQLEVLSDFLKASGIIPYLRSLNFREIAKRYNGPGYESGNYHIKLQRAYQKYKL